MNSEIENALRTALKLESDGARFYEMAAKNTEHKGVREVFNTLASDEREHYRTILTYYEHFADAGKWPEKSIERALEHSSHELEKMFTPEFLESLKSSTNELSAISTGALLEQESIKFYKDKAFRESDIFAKEFYEELVKIEQEHHKLLIKIEKKLLDSVWKTNRYSPF
jgi:rubrerythrin